MSCNDVSAQTKIGLGQQIVWGRNLKRLLFRRYVNVGLQECRVGPDTAAGFWRVMSRYKVGKGDGVFARRVRLVCHDD